MRLLTLLLGRDDIPAPAALVVAFDGWTDAGAGGTGAVEHLRSLGSVRRVGALPSDALYDFRDRRPQLSIDRGRLGRPEWPELVLDLVEVPDAPPLLVLTGPEPDLGWQALAADVIDLVDLLDVPRYIGLGSVPGPLPHTRPVMLVCTSSDPELLERLGAPHERMIVPASCQVAIEAELATAGTRTLGLWVRIPHYVAGPYPEASRRLLAELAGTLDMDLDLDDLDIAIEANRQRLEVASSASDEIVEHVRQLEALYDAELAEAGPSGRGGIASPITEADVPSADELAAEIERFLRNGGTSSGG
jgi:hypothetical protein